MLGKGLERGRSSLRQLKGPVDGRADGGPSSSGA